MKKTIMSGNKSIICHTCRFLFVWNSPLIKPKNDKFEKTLLSVRWSVTVTLVLLLLTWFKKGSTKILPLDRSQVRFMVNVIFLVDTLPRIFTFPVPFRYDLILVNHLVNGYTALWIESCPFASVQSSELSY